MRRLAIASCFALGCGRLGFAPGAPPLADAALDAPVDPDLVVWLPLDDDPQGGTVDQLGTLGSGRCTSTCPASTGGRIGQAYDFSAGTGGIAFDSVPALDFSTAGQPMSIALWYRSRSLGLAQQVLVSKALPGGQVSYQLALEDLHGEGTLGLVWKVCVGTCDGEDFAYLPAGAERDVWRLVVGVWTGSTSELYVDGALKSSLAKPSFSFDELSPLVIGADLEATGYEDVIDGQLDDVRIYKRALSVADQQALLSR